MRRPRIETKIVGFTEREWQQIRLAAAALQARDVKVAALMLPGRPELYRLEKKGRQVELHLTREEELAETLRGEQKQS